MTRQPSPALLDQRAARVAALVADGTPLHVAGARLGLSKGETASAWRRVRRDLGDQAR